MIDARNTGRFIKEQRRRLGLSQLQLAAELHVEPQTISKWERGLGMPDYDNLSRLKEVFDCELSEILEPPIDAERDAGAVTVDDARAEETTYLPVLAAIFDEADDSEGRHRRFSIFDYLNRKRIGEYIRRIFGYEYEDIYNRKFLFKNVLRPRTRAEREETLTQGMLHGGGQGHLLGIEAPWLYLRVFLFLLGAFGLSLLLFFVSMQPMPLIIIGSLLAAVPLLIFLFETNFSRNVSIFSLFKLFIYGGLLSLITTLITVPFVENEVLSAVFFAPLFEEIAKAAITVLFVSRIRPKSMLSGLLIGFAVGAGFDVFETLNYAYVTILLAEDVDVATVGPVAIVLMRTFSSFFSGHHYFTGIFGAIYVLCKQNVTFSMRDLIRWRVLAALGVSMILHALWNLSGFLTPFWMYWFQFLVSVICVGGMLLLINIGIAQAKLMEICEVARDARESEEQAADA